MSHVGQDGILPPVGNRRRPIANRPQLNKLPHICVAVLLAASLWPLPADAQEKKERRQPKQQGEITLRVVEAGSAANMANDAAALIPAELKKLLTFTHYRLLDSGYIRGLEGEELVLRLAGDLRGEVTFRVRSGSTSRDLEYNVEIEGPGPPSGSPRKLLETTATGKSGETIVLGASRMQETSKALIVLLTGKFLP
jgi:hypothetical protein